MSTARRSRGDGRRRKAAQPALDEALSARAATRAEHAERSDGAPEHPDVTLLLAARLVELVAQLNETKQRAEVAEAEAAKLMQRVRELETWLEDRASFDEIEHVQLGRLFALELAKREQRRMPLLASSHAALLVVYAAALTCFAWLLLTERI